MKPRQGLKNYPIPNLTSPFQNSSTSQSSAPREVDLSKLPLNLNEMPNLQANQISNHEELVECLQAIYGKNNTEVLQKLPQLNEWPLRSVSPPDFSRLATNSGPGGSSISQSNRANFNNATSNNNNNIISNNNSSGQQKQDTPYSASQHPSQASAINHFRVSASNLHSQQKSVLSLHQHHQNDLSNRRLNQHISTTNASFLNLNSVNSANSTSAPNLSLDTNSSSILGASNIVTKNPGLSGSSTHVPNIMDAISSIDNMFNDGTIPTNKDTSNYQQSMRHQQLQKLLKASSSQVKSSPPSSSTLSHRSDSQSQRNVNANNMSQAQLPSTSPASLMSPSQPAFSSVPKSLLNLAACSSSPSSSNNQNLRLATAKFSSMVSQLNLRSARHQNSNNGNQSGANTCVNSNRSTAKTNNVNNITNSNNDAFNQRAISVNDNSANVLQQQNARSVLTNTGSNLGQTSRATVSKQLQMSLLSDDQSTSSRTNLRNVGANLGSKGQLLNQRPNLSQTSKEAYLAELQERAAKVGVSIGEINKAVQSNNITSVNTTTNICQQTSPLTPINEHSEESVNIVDRKEIESAISRVEARNDLSLLYPPMLLATSSQKQINALSAGLQGAEESELFTKEVRKIVLEECNIIYECKKCNNLFRSLANLIKHKRTYCFDTSNDRNIVDANKYSQTGLPQEMPMTNNSAYSVVRDSNMPLPESEIVNETTTENMRLDTDYSQDLLSYDRRNNIGHDLRMLRAMRNQERKNLHDRDVSTVRQRIPNDGPNFSTPQTSLSKLLQSQPKNRLPVSRDSTLMGALSMKSNYQSSDSPLGNSLSKCDLDRSCSGEVDEQLIRHSSLAKTLLNEKVRTAGPRQSLIELSKAKTNQSDIVNKRIVPKRKLLEDCIKKVKRDKLLNEEDLEQIPISSASTSLAARLKSSGVNKQKQMIADARGTTLSDHDFNDPNKMTTSDDSDMESDQLMIDLEGPKQNDPAKKIKRRPSTAASSSSSSSSSVRLNTSSALLKALTRPVDPKKPYMSSQQLCENRSSPTQQDKPLVKCPDPQTKLRGNNPNVNEEDEKNSAETNEILNSLFDKYTCDACEIDFETSGLLTEHINEKHSEGMRLVYPCLFCSFSFITLENACRHVIDIHKKPKEQMARLKEISKCRAHYTLNYATCSDTDYGNNSHSRVESESNDQPSSQQETDNRSDPTTSNHEAPAVQEDHKSTNTSPMKARVSQQHLETVHKISTSSEISDTEVSVDIQDPESDVSQADDQEMSSPITIAQHSEQTSQRSQSSNQSPEVEQRQVESSYDSDSEISVDSQEPESSASQADDIEAKSPTAIPEQCERASQASPVSDESPEAKMKPACSEDSDSEISVVSQDPDSDGSQVGAPNTQSLNVGSDQTRQASQRSSSSNKSASETAASTSSGGGGGGIMKLKIQLKTRPDEKSKVYEIV